MKRNNANNKMKAFASGYRRLLLSCLGSALLLLSACYDRTEGCLDIEATNFSFSAEDACATCCTYPSLRIEIKHVFGDTVLPFGAPFTLDSIDYFRLINWRFYLTDLKLVALNEQIGVFDTISLVIDNNGTIVKELVEDNYAISTRSTFSLNLGTTRFSGTLDSVRFLVGLDALSNQTLADSMLSGHPLAIQSDSMYLDENQGYIFNKIRFQADTITGLDTTTVEIFGDANLVAVSLPYNRIILKGSNIIVNLQVDYKLWLKGINFAADSDAEIISKIVANTAEAISTIN